MSTLVGLPRSSPDLRSTLPREPHFVRIRIVTCRLRSHPSGVTFGEVFTMTFNFVNIQAKVSCHASWPRQTQTRSKLPTNLHFTDICFSADLQQIRDIAHCSLQGNMWQTCFCSKSLTNAYIHALKPCKWLANHIKAIFATNIQRKAMFWHLILLTLVQM